jgi:peptidoglycan/xylan/chitin deacetylase (PgdA/CDA1 family)
MSGGGSRTRGRYRRRADERARLAKLVRISVTVVIASLLVDAIVGRAFDRSPASGASEASTNAGSSPPVTLMPLSATPGVAPVITRVATTDPVVFLTIDDGHTRTPGVRAALEEAGIPATLFLNDGPVEADAEFFRRLPDTVVEAHTRTHADLGTLSEEAQRAEICGNADTIERAIGRRPVLFRPPYGVHNDATLRAAASCGMAAVVLWEASANGDVVRFRSVVQVRRVDILLMHFRPSFVTELRSLVERVEAAGLRFALLEDYLVPDSVE